MDLAERLAALKERNEAPSPPTTYEMGEDELKARYLAALAEGEMPDQAARRLGKTGSYMRSFRSEKSIRYDPDFEEAYEEIMRPDGEHRSALIGIARESLVEAAKAGNVRAIEKILMAYDPDFGFLKPAQFTGDFNVDKLMVVLSDGPTPILQQVRQALESQRALPDVEA